MKHCARLLILILVLSLNLIQSGQLTAQDNIRENLATVQTMFDEVINAESLTGMTVARYFSPSVEFHWPFPDQYGTWSMDTIRIYSTISGLRSTFDDFQQVITHIAGRDDLVFAHYKGSGIFINRPSIAQISNIEPTGEAVEWEGIYLFRLEDGKIVEWWWYEDNPILWNHHFD